MKRLTIFTPTYNRAQLLVRLYKSLKNQTNHDFLWMVVDDGSTDNTRELVNNWIENEKSFDINYIYKKNGGLHTGYNTAIENCNTDFMMCIDSDDYCPNDAVQKVLNHWDKYGSDKYAGIVGLDFDTQGNCIGDFLPEQKSVNLIDLMIGKYNLNNGDRTNFVRTELYKAVAPVPVYEGEKSFNPHYLHIKISQTYDFLVLNECLRVVEYQEGGMSNSVFKQYFNSPVSYRELRKFNLGLKDTPLMFRVKNTIHYISSSIIAKKPIIKDCPNKLLCIVLLIPGLLLSFLVRIKVKSRKQC